MSGLTKKTVYTDKVLSTLLGVSEGDVVSYADISKGIHRYIKANNLRNPPQPQPSRRISEPPPAQETKLPKTATTADMKQCRDCGAEIPAEAVFCDLCGMTQ